MGEKKVRAFWTNHPATDLIENLRSVLTATYCKTFPMTPLELD